MKRYILAIILMAASHKGFAQELTIPQVVGVPTGAQMTVSFLLHGRHPDFSFNLSLIIYLAKKWLREKPIIDWLFIKPATHVIPQQQPVVN